MNPHIKEWANNFGVNKSESSMDDTVLGELHTIIKSSKEEIDSKIKKL